ncbi:MAG: glycoside hydrolase family 16 protein [Candidatus Hydrogenedentota bacterium]
MQRTVAQKLGAVALIMAWAVAWTPWTALADDAEREGWNLVWQEEFDYEGLPDPEKWTQEYGFIRNEEAQYYTRERPENARVEDGRLIIEAHEEHYPNAAHEEGADHWRRAREYAEYTSASLTTEDRQHFQYGRIEVRARLPQGQGVWPAIWMLGENHRDVGWPRCGEIDIMEFVGFQPNTIHANIHTQAYNHSIGTGRGDTIEAEAPWEEFHLYGIEWDEERIDFFFDDEVYFAYEKEADAGEAEWPFDQPFYLILNVAIGGAWGGQQGIDDDIFPQRMEVDYVRVYERE